MGRYGPNRLWKEFRFQIRPLVNKEETSIVERHTPLQDLRTLPNVLNMQLAYGGCIEVSPAGSADSHSKSNVVEPQADLIQSVKNAILNDRSFLQEFKEKYEEEIMEGIEQKLDQKASLLSDYTIWSMTFMGTRNIEDWALKRMKKELRLPITIKISPGALIDRFVANYTFAIVNMKDIDHLKSSPLCKQANEMFHLNIDTDVDKMNWNWNINYGRRDRG